MQALQTIQDQQVQLITAFAPVAPLLQSLPLYIDAAKNDIQVAIRKMQEQYKPLEPVRGALRGRRGYSSDSLPPSSCYAAPRKKRRLTGASPGDSDFDIASGSDENGDFSGSTVNAMPLSQTSPFPAIAGMAERSRSPCRAVRQNAYPSEETLTRSFSGPTYQRSDEHTPAQYADDHHMSVLGDVPSADTVSSVAAAPTGAPPATMVSPAVPLQPSPSPSRAVSSPALGKPLHTTAASASPVSQPAVSDADLVPRHTDPCGTLGQRGERTPLERARTPVDPPTPSPIQSAAAHASTSSDPSPHSPRARQRVPAATDHSTLTPVARGDDNLVIVAPAPANGSNAVESVRPMSLKDRRLMVDAASVSVGLTAGHGILLSRNAAYRRETIYHSG